MKVAHSLGDAKTRRDCCVPRHLGELLDQHPNDRYDSGRWGRSLLVHRVHARNE